MPPGSYAVIIEPNNGNPFLVGPFNKADACGFSTEGLRDCVFSVVDLWWGQRQ